MKIIVDVITFLREIHLRRRDWLLVGFLFFLFLFICADNNMDPHLEGIILLPNF
jgi:hypothetical protein